LPFYRTDEELEALVRKFLRGIGLENQVHPDLLTVIVKIKHIDPRFNYQRLPDKQMPASEAIWDSADRLVRIRESVFLGMNRNEPRARMTVAHELAHYILKHRGFLHRKAGISVRDIPIASIRHEESEAKRTGPIILAPEHLIPESADAEQIASLFGLSKEAALYRYDEVARIRRRRRGEKRPLPVTIVDYLREAQRRGHHIRTDIQDE
jgi:hypothetical protein